MVFLQLTLTLGLFSAGFSLFPTAWQTRFSLRIVGKFENESSIVFLCIELPKSSKCAFSLQVRISLKSSSFLFSFADLEEILLP